MQISAFIIELFQKTLSCFRVGDVIVSDFWGKMRLDVWLQRFTH